MTLKLKRFIVRVLALIAYESLSTFGLSSGLGIDKVQAALVAALLPLVMVMREAAKGLIDDGVLSDKEMDDAIEAGKSAKKK